MANEKNYGDKYVDLMKKTNLQKKLDRLLTKIKQSGYVVDKTTMEVKETIKGTK